MKRKISLIFLSLLMGLMLVCPVMAQTECVEENTIGIAVHCISIVLIVIMVIIVFFAASRFAESLGKAMKIVGLGFVFLGLDSILTELHHFGIAIIPEGPFHSWLHHSFGALGYILLTYGFWKVYEIARGVARGKKRKNEK